MSSSLNTNLISYWKLDGSSVDSVGSNNGTDTNITYSLGNGKINQGAGFNGVTSRINLPNAARSGNSFSASIWFNWVSGDGELWCEGENAFADASIESATGRLRVENETNTHSFTAYFSANGSIVSGTWYHLVYVYDSSSGYLTVYLNNSVVINVSVGGNQVYSSTAYFMLGCYGYTPSLYSSYFNGAIDEFATWSRALSSGEVSELYANGGARQYPFGQNFLMF